MRGSLRALLIMLLLAIVGAPFLWVLLSSFQPNAVLIRSDGLFSWADATLDNYVNLQNQANFGPYLFNSLAVALGSTAVAVPLALMSAYSVFRTRYRGRRAVYNLLLLVYVFPGVLLLAPLFRIFSTLGILNTFVSLVVVNVTFAAPFSVWLMRGFFASVPAGIEEAAAVDGASDLRILRSIIIPLTAPGVVVAATYTFVLSWTEYMFASVFLVDDRLKTLPLGLEALVTQYSIDWGLLAAAAVATALPVILVFACVGRYFVDGITAGAGK